MLMYILVAAFAIVAIAGIVQVRRLNKQLSEAAAQAAADDAAGPARQAPTLYRPGEKPDDTK